MDQGVMGNHDNAMANDKGCGCRADFKIYAEETLDWHRTLLDRDDIEFLKSLPVTLYVHIDGMSIYMTHGAPDGDIYRYLKEEEIGEEEIKGLEKYDSILLGHTHFQFKKQIGNVTIVNPGSIGLSRQNHDACYAVLEDGDVTLDCRFTASGHQGAGTVLRASAKWFHAQYVGLEVNGRDP